jgi:tetratricopeptide (TPR) repeat protein
MAGRAISVGVFLAFFASWAAAQPAPVSDFPPHDHSTVFQLDRDGGRALVDALRTKPARASALVTLLHHKYLDESLTVLARIVNANGADLVPALKAVRETSWDDHTGREDIGVTLTKILQRAKAAGSRRSRAEAAEIERHFLQINRSNSRGKREDGSAKLQAFIAKYNGTPTALMAEVELIEALPIPQRVEAAERFAHAHEGTVAGARALYQAGSDLAHSYDIRSLERRRGADPTDRLKRVAAIARELESGRYPPSEWVSRAPSLVMDVSFSGSPPPTFAAGNLQRALDEHTAFVRSHLSWEDPFPPNDQLAYFIGHRMWDLWALQGDPFVAAEKFFDDLAVRPGLSEAARFLQARTYLSRRPEQEPDAALRRTKAIADLTDLARNGRPRVRSRAHAMLASELSAGGEDAAACAEFRRFVTAYPRSDWAWVASLRIGQCEEALHHWQSAADAYAQAAVLHTGKPAAVLLGHTYAARALEGTGNFKAALNEYDQAITAWFGKDSSRYSLSTLRVPPTRDTTDVLKTDLQSRREELRVAMATPGGELLERARWALVHESRRAARLLVDPLASPGSGSPLAREARYLVHRADYEDALDLAASDDPRDLSRAVQQLERLSRESHDVIVSLAKIARATLMFVQGTSGSDALMQQALGEWRSSQISPPPGAPGSIEADADAVRRVVFQPLGGGVFPQTWNANGPRRSLPPFLIASSTLAVQEFNGRVTMVRSSRPIPGLENTIYLSKQDFELLQKTILTLGGNPPRVPASVRATPNQPARNTDTIRKFWDRFFPMGPGPWVNWQLATSPVIGRIEFTNAQRTKASVPVTVGTEGGTVLLEKINGEWRVLRMVNRWIA